MITICSYCRKTIKKIKPYKDKRISHGICPACYDYHVPRLLKRDLSRHLDGYDQPVIMVDCDGRIIGINKAMCSFLGKPREEVLGLLGGELMGCRYSRLPEGCGQTVHCSACSIRQTVNKSRSTGDDLQNVAACLDCDTERMHFSISAFNRGEFVKVVVEKILKTEPLPGA